MPTDSDLLDALEELGDDGDPPTVRELQEADVPYSPKDYYDAFGSWNDALERAGYEPRETSGPYSEEELIEDLQAFADDLGHPPASKQMMDHGPHSISTYVTRFGGWKKALREAGFEPEDVPEKSARNDPA